MEQYAPDDSVCPLATMAAEPSLKHGSPSATTHEENLRLRRELSAIYASKTWRWDPKFTVGFNNCLLVDVNDVKHDDGCVCFTILPPVYQSVPFGNTIALRVGTISIATVLNQISDTMYANDGRPLCLCLPTFPFGSRVTALNLNCLSRSGSPVSGLLHVSIIDNPADLAGAESIQLLI